MTIDPSRTIDTDCGGATVTRSGEDADAAASATAVWLKGPCADGEEADADATGPAGAIAATSKAASKPTVTIIAGMTRRNKDAVPLT